MKNTITLSTDQYAAYLLAKNDPAETRMTWEIAADVAGISRDTNFVITSSTMNANLPGASITLHVS